MSDFFIGVACGWLGIGLGLLATTPSAAETRTLAIFLVSAAAFIATACIFFHIGRKWASSSVLNGNDEQPATQGKPK